MEAIVVLLVVVIGLAPLDQSALRWRAVSRDPVPDDERR